MCLQYFNFSVLYAKHIFPTVSFFFFLYFSFANVRRFAKHTTLKQPKQTGAKCCYVLASIEHAQAHTIVYAIRTQTLFDLSLKAKRSASSLKKNVMRKICKILWYAFRLWFLFCVVYSPYRTPIEFRKWQNWTNLIAHARSMASAWGYRKFCAFKWKIRFFPPTNVDSAYGCAKPVIWVAIDFSNLLINCIAFWVDANGERKRIFCICGFCGIFMRAH